MKRMLVALTLALTCLAAGTVSAQANDEKITSQVNELLGGIEYSPTVKEWQAIGPDAAAVLRTIASNPKALATRRARATAALQAFDDADTKAFLKTLLNTEKTPMVVRRRAVQALGVYGNDSIASIQPYLTTDNKRLRESAIKAMARVKTPEAKAVLEARLKVEPAKYLKLEIEKGIKGINITQ